MNRYVHLSKFGYFYGYCLLSNNQEIKREISKLKEIVELTNNLDARNNFVYNKKLLRKEVRVEKILHKIARQAPEFLLIFIKEYCNEIEGTTLEKDPNIIARNISQSFFDIYKINDIKKHNIVSEKNNFKEKENDIIINLSEEEKNLLDEQDKSNKPFTTFISELKTCNYPNINRQLNTLNKILQVEVKKKETKEEYEKRINKLSRYAFSNIDMIFKKGFNYPFRKKFIKVLSKLIYLYDIKERKLNELNKYIKDSLRLELLNKYTNNTKISNKDLNYGYVIPSDTSVEMLIKVNEELEKEKSELIEINKRGQRIKFDRPFSNSVQSKKVDIINSYFDERFEFDLTIESEKEDFVKVIMNLCELGDEITDAIFKKVLFDAHDSSNLVQLQSYEKNEALRTLHSLYSPSEKLDKFEQTKLSFENVFKLLTSSKRDTIYKMVYEEKQKKHMPIIEVIPSKETIMNNLAIRETKFIESHAVEEFKHKALNHGKYLNYDLEIIARDINVEDLPTIYQNLKRNITYTNFIEEIKPGEDREKKYKEARIVQKKTLAVAQEMIAKTIINKSYNHEYDLSYDDYQTILNSIYENVLHEERLLHSYDDFYDESEILEKNYQEKKRIWDEQSAFVKALYLIVSKKDNR